ncbi:signal peptidase I [Effusibacillus dendaii]|uniref:Signal peptidase I n=1 Tax=Effusibacillus dendaii TaxID=2743772 RepID=A0A7I8DDU6_9BACL|nr:signal peptidase I [Effusibacillus dendaii]BCJ86996.1 signal peptidase I [Effusibacillus dendaii]
MKSLKETISWIGTLATAVALSVLISAFVFQPTKVLGSSMEPTLQNNEYIFISKLPHTLKSEPDYGDIVIIDSRIDRTRTVKDDIVESPFFNLVTGHTDHDTWVKRVIGKPGDVLEFRDHKVYRNGTALNEPYLKETMNYSTNQKITVPADHIFVMGDNRNYSKDSRMIGSIPLDHVLGKMVIK